MEANFRTILVKMLTGKGAHVLTKHALSGLEWELAGRKAAGFPHTVFQIVNHMIYWQEFCLTLIAGGDPKVPPMAADSWPGAEKPADREELERVKVRFVEGVDRAVRFAETCDLKAPIRFRPNRTIAEDLKTIARHNSYHLGQVVTIRRILGSWPPPEGGDTW